MKTNEQNTTRTLQENRSHGREEIPPQDNTRTASQDAGISEKQKKNFFKKVNKDGIVPSLEKYGNIGKCWLFMTSRNKGGYGQVKLRGAVVKAHRVSWMIIHGQIYGKLQVLHKCDNPSCVNPDHLWLGTPKDNADDMYLKGRGNKARGDRHPSRAQPETRPRGEEHGGAKLTEEKVREIRRLYAEGDITHKEIADKFGVSTKPISQVINLKTWRHVA